MVMKQAQQVLQAVIGMAFYCQKHEWVGYMFCSVFGDNRLSVWYVSGGSFVKKILE